MFFLLNWYDSVTFLLQSIDVVYYTKWFANIKPTLHPWNKPHLFTVYNLISLLFRIGYFYCFVFQYTDSLLCLLYFLLSQSIKASYFCSSCQEGYPPDWSACPAVCCPCGHNLELLEIDFCSQNRSQEQGGMVRSQGCRVGVWPCSVQAKVWWGHLHLWIQVDIQTELEKYKHEEGSECCSGSWLPMVAAASHIDLRHAVMP